MRRNSIVAFILMGILAMTVSCRERKPEQPAVAKVHIFTVQDSRDISAQDFPGRVIAAKEVNMAFKVSGTLNKVYVEEGSKISKGQLIAEIDPRDYRLQLEATKAEYQGIKAEAERVIALYADSVSTASDYDKARYGLEQITAKYQNARNQLADTKIYAPFNGYVQKLLLDPPTVVAAGMPIMTLIADNGWEVEINVPSSIYIRREEITVFRTSFDVLPNQTVMLTPVSYSPKANANQLYTVRLALPQDLSPLPSPGMAAMVEIVFNDDSTKAEIPSSALFFKDGQCCIWVYDPGDGRVNRRAVTVDRLDTEGHAIISAGISAGEQIVVTGVHKFSDNQRVSPLANASATNVGGLL